MKMITFINLIMILNSFQLQAQQIFHRNGKVAWSGSTAYHDNGKIAWSGSTAYHDNGKIAWSGSTAYHDNGKIAWSGSTAYYDNGKIAYSGSTAYHDNSKIAWSGSTAYYDDGKILVSNLYSQIQDVNLKGLELSELKVSDKLKLLTKTFKNKVYVVGLKIQLSEKNAILINKESKTTSNIIELGKNIHLEIENKKVKLSILGQNVVTQK
jgi:hypothetical protein